MSSPSFVGDQLHVSPPKESPDRDLHRTLMLLNQLGFTVLVCILAGFGLGLFLDSRLGTSPLFVILCLIVGIAGGFWRAYSLIMRAIR